MNAKILFQQLSHPSVIHDTIGAVLWVSSDQSIGTYLHQTLQYTTDARASLYILEGLGYLGESLQPTDQWQQLAAAEPRVRRELFRSAFQDAFRGSDGSSATEVIETIANLPGRIDWFVQQHGLARSTTAIYAERLYREGIAALDPVLPLEPPQAPLASEPPTSSATQTIRAVLRDSEHGNRIELVFHLPDSDDAAVHKAIFRAAELTLFSDDGHWAPLDSVEFMKVVPVPWYLHDDKASATMTNHWPPGGSSWPPSRHR